MRIILTYLILTILLISCSHTYEKIERYPNGQISSKFATTSDGLKNGSYVTYYENGKNRSEGNYENDKQNGFWTTWFDNGNKSTEGNFDKGRLIGEWKYYYENGKLQQINHYKNDKSDGEFIEFDENGIMTRKAYCINGLMNGKSIKYYPNGITFSECIYKNHKADGPFTEYYADGKLMAKGNWKDTLLVGDYFLFDSLDTGNYTQCFYYANTVPSDTEFVFKNNKLKQYKIYDNEAKERFVDVE